MTPPDFRAESLSTMVGDLGKEIAPQAGPGPASLGDSQVRDLIAADVEAAILRWRADPEFHVQAAGVPAASMDDADVPAYATDCATRAALASFRPVTDGPAVATARFCLVTKRPHADSTATVLAIVGRALALGIHIHEIRQLGRFKGIGAKLYPAAYRYFCELPRDEATWTALANVFDRPAFQDIFGQSYSTSLVRSGHQAMVEFSLSSAELTALWEEGRQDIARENLACRYGRTAAEHLLGQQDSYPWFRGVAPFGIHRISPGLMAFAFRHERVDNGKPTIILNGHFPGLSELFSEQSVVIQAGITQTGPQIAHVRRWLVGDDNRPAACQPGSIRRDAQDGRFPSDSPVSPDSRMNVLHCSDGLLAGMIETRALFQQTGWEGELAEQLRASGLTDAELTELVAADPLVHVAGNYRRLTELTAGQGLSDCLQTITRFVPPVFGRTNGYASGMPLSYLSEGLTAAAGSQPEQTQWPKAARRSLSMAPARPQSLTEKDDQLGRELMGAGQLGVVIPSGGTGGRFGGYDRGESDLGRQKTLVPVFRLSGQARCALDVRVANTAHWQTETGGAIPVAVMGSPTNSGLLRSWNSERASLSGVQVITYQQHGTYRITSPDGPHPAGQAHPRWQDAIVRNHDGTPALKPPGNLGTLTCLALSGILERWDGAGIQFLAIANGDDVGFRLDPRILGYLYRHPAVDAVITAVPWGIRGQTLASGRRVSVRADASGWCLASTGEVGSLQRAGASTIEVRLGSHVSELVSPVLDGSGWLCEVATDRGWRLGVSERANWRHLPERDLLSTNQIYLRVAALRSLMGLGDYTDVPSAVARFVTQQPFLAERKTVQTDAGSFAAVQASQAMSSIFQQLSVVPLRISRAVSPGQYGGYAPLKVPSDVAFAQLFLDCSASSGDQLRFS